MSNNKDIMAREVLSLVRLKMENQEMIECLERWSNDSDRVVDERDFVVDAIYEMRTKVERLRKENRELASMIEGLMKELAR
jgi:uncharacterized coiled-coil DUF342 family protein